MNKPRLPLILEPDELERHLGEAGLLIVDLCKPEVYPQYHIPGAVPLEYGKLVAQQGLARGLLPDDDQLEELFSAIGLTPETHVVAYDDEGGGKAGRLLWTLDAIGHQHLSLLNGGLQAWYNEGHPGSNEPTHPSRSDYRISKEKRGIADAAHILARLNNPHTIIFDARSPNEYQGLTNTALRNGHIPGAVNLDWTFAMDPDHNLRLKPEAALREALESRGVTPDKEVIVHCQTHHRSAFTYVVLKALGYSDVKGYAGSWSDWGNRDDTPVETGARPV